MKTLKPLIVTPCGARKGTEPAPARQLYKSTRIRAVYGRRCNRDMAILSARYGLVDVETHLAPYDQLMDHSRARELLPQTCEYVQNGDYDVLVYFRGGTGSNYLDLMRWTSEASKVPLVFFGYANRDNLHVSHLPEITRLAARSQFTEIENLCESASVCLVPLADDSGH